MKLITCLIFIFICIKTFGQEQDTINTEYGKFVRQKIDSLYFNLQFAKNKAFIDFYNMNDAIGKIYSQRKGDNKTIQTQKSKIFKTGKTLIILTTKNDTVKFEDRTELGEGNENYQYIKFIIELNSYLIWFTGWECHSFILVDSDSGETTQLQSNLLIHRNLKMILTFDDGILNGEFNPISIFYYSKGIIKSEFRIISNWDYNSVFLDNNKDINIRCRKDPFYSNKIDYYKFWKLK